MTPAEIVRKITLYNERKEVELAQRQVDILLTAWKTAAYYRAKKLPNIKNELRKIEQSIEKKEKNRKENPISEEELINIAKSKGLKTPP